MGKSVFFFLAVISIFGACNFGLKAHHSSKQTAAVNKDKKSPELTGVYVGMLPCADCSGIKTEIRLNRDSTYETAAMYLGKSAGAFLSHGHYKWDKNAGKIILEKGEGFNIAPSQFLVQKDSLIGLNAEGKRFQGPLPPHTFCFQKISFDDTITGKYWRLIELNGKKVLFYKNLKRVPHFILKADNKINGTDGCNTFVGNYKILTKNKIQFSGFISTKMACLDAPYQKDFLKLLEHTEYYLLQGDTLSLGKTRITPSAKFVAIYIK